MNEMQDQLTRLEARIEHQTARIDALYQALEREGILPLEVADVPFSRRSTKPPARRRTAGFRLGNATGV